MKSGRIWIAIVIALLAMNLVAGGVLVFYAQSDEALGVEKDYYQKGLHWDDHVRRLQESAATGWSLTLKVLRDDGSRHGARVIAVLKDRDGSSVVEADVRAQAYHVAESGNRAELRFHEESPGQYEAPLQLRRFGWWEFELEASSGDSRFIAESRQFVPPASGRASP